MIIECWHTKHKLGNGRCSYRVSSHHSCFRRRTYSDPGKVERRFNFLYFFLPTTYIASKLYVFKKINKKSLISVLLVSHILFEATLYLLQQWLHHISKDGYPIGDNSWPCLSNEHYICGFYQKLMWQGDNNGPYLGDRG